MPQAAGKKPTYFMVSCMGKKVSHFTFSSFGVKKGGWVNNSIMGLHDTERYKKKEKTGTYIVKAFVTNDGGCIRQMKHLNPKPPPEKKQPGLVTVTGQIRVLMGEMEDSFAPTRGHWFTLQAKQ